MDELIAGIRELGESFMEDTLAVYRWSDDVYPWDDDAVRSDDYGDSETYPIEPAETPSAYIDTFSTWVVTRLNREIQSGDGAITVVNDLLVRVPVGSDLRPRDVVLLTSTGEQKTVFETNQPDTWAEWMQATLRGLE